MKFYYLIILFVLIPLTVSARSGCCSSHGGVCGCGCCDGTGLSATCAPYYPQCNGSAIDSPLNNTQRQVPAPVKSIESEDYSWLGWVVAVGTIGGLGYYIGKNKK